MALRVDPISITHPDIAAEWDYDKNGDMTPDKVTRTSNFKAHWKCSHGHEWVVVISSRTQHSSGCPHCEHRIATLGEYSIATEYPEMAAEWDYDRNPPDKTPDTLLPSDKQKYWWKCEHGHSFENSPYNRTTKETAPEYIKCPYCSHHIATPGEYSLAVLYPELMEEWNWDKNEQDGLDPDHLLPGSNKKAHWKCAQGHEWRAVISSRAQSGNGCPYCSHKLALPGVYSLLTEYPELSKEWDYDKNPTELNPDNVLPSDNHKYWWKCAQGHSFEQSPYNRVRRHTAPDYYECPHCARKIATPGEYSFATEYPELVKEWNWDINNAENIDPNKVLPNFNREVHWKCASGHEWQMTPAQRAKGRGCPYCSGARAIPGETSLAALYPELVEEWDWKENAKRGLNPDTLKPGAHVNAHWKCEQGHEWDEDIYKRLASGRPNKCPECRPRRAPAFRPGINDLATLHPDIAAEWSDKNESSPSEVHAGTSKKFWWKCPTCGHEWASRVNHRTKNGHGCPACAGTAAGPLNNLAYLYSDIASEWDYEANDALFGEHKTPSDFAPRSSVEVYWQCPNDPLHKYKMRIGHRTEGYACPFCSHHQIIPGNNSLAAEYPELLAEWDWEKNEVDPDTIAPGAAMSVWWKCSECGREWQASVADRTTKGHGCQECKQGIGTSFAEQVCYLGAQMLFPDLKVMNRYHTEFKREIDIYIPALGIGLEPGHWALHKDKLDKDAEKIRLCFEHGIRVYTIFEQFPKGAELPFDEDCYGYASSARMNNTHLAIRDILKEIFAEHMDEIPSDLWDDDRWHEIARLAHLKLAKLL